MKRVDVDVDVHHLTRVEGHGDITIRIRDGIVEEARWRVVETPRFFEVMLKGQDPRAAALLTARICGICSIGHTLASVRASERAFGVEVPELAARLRLLAKHGETLQSHVLHLVFLAAPDYLQLPSALPLADADPRAFAVAARLKSLGNRLCDAVAGRTTHPVSITLGGMTRRPDPEGLRALRADLDAAPADLDALAAIFAGFELPPFERETEYVSLGGDRAYPWIGGHLVSSDGVVRPEDDYLAMTHEVVVADSTSKRCHLSRESFAVGALARFNNNHRLLHPAARRLAAAVGLTAPAHNPYATNLAQLVECAHVVHEARALVDAVLDTPPDAPHRVAVTPRAGRGVGAVEVPRGILYHDYTYDDAGRVAHANCVIPTTQNNANIERDLAQLAGECAARGALDAEVERLAAMLVRAYDPCVSCSVH